MVCVDSVIAVSGVKKSFSSQKNKVIALNDVSIRVGRGELVGLLGPNGSGKTTLVKVINSLIEADAGEIQINGHLVTSGGKGHLRHLGTVLEGKTGVNERLSCRENAKYYCHLKGAQFETEYLYELSDLLGFEDLDVPVRALSTGNKIRVALIVAIIHKPDIIFMDEPTLGLDVKGVQSLKSVLKTLSAQGVTLFISSHDLEFLEHVTARIVCLRRGRIAFDGKASELVKNDYAFGARVRLKAHFAGEELISKFDCIVESDGEVRFFFKSYSDMKSFVAQLEGYEDSVEAFEISTFRLKDNYLSFLKEDVADD